MITNKTSTQQAAGETLRLIAKIVSRLTIYFVLALTIGFCYGRGHFNGESVGLAVDLMLIFPLLTLAAKWVLKGLEVLRAK